MCYDNNFEDLLVQVMYLLLQYDACHVSCVHLPLAICISHFGSHQRHGTCQFWSMFSNYCKLMLHIFVSICGNKIDEGASYVVLFGNIMQNYIERDMYLGDL